jgi:NADH-quinone oxidoreductase subunit G
VVRAVAELKAVAVPALTAAFAAEPAHAGSARRIAESLAGGSSTAIFLGNLAQHQPQAAVLHHLAHELAQLLGARLGFLGEAANSVGGYLANAVPFGAVAGLNARAMLASPRKAYLLWNAEPELDCHDPQQALAAMRAAELVVACTAFRHHAADYAHVLLPIGAFTETAGTFVNTEGRAQSFVGVVKPVGEARPGWKVLRVLGGLLGLPGFDYDSAEAVRSEAFAGLDVAARLSNLPAGGSAAAQAAAGGIQRIADVPIYFADALVRRSDPLQMTRDAAAPAARMCAALMSRLGLREGDRVRVSQGAGSALLKAIIDPAVPSDCVRVAAAHALTAGLGEMFGAVTLERVTQGAEVAA